MYGCADSVRIPARPLLRAGGKSVLPTWVAEERRRVSGQEPSEEGERMHADLVRKAKERKLDEWEQFKVFSPVRMGAQAKDVVDTRRALTWEVVEGEIQFFGSGFGGLSGSRYSGWQR